MRKLDAAERRTRAALWALVARCRVWIVAGGEAARMEVCGKLFGCFARVSALYAKLG